MIVLIIEDEEGIRSGTKSLLEHLGHSVLEACNGKEALEIVSAHKVDFQIVDITMPVMDGLTYLEKCEKFDIPTVVATGYSDVKVKVPVFAKPYGLKDLRRMLEHAK